MSDIRHTTYDIRTSRILIVNPFGIGDVLFTTPIIEAIKRKHPKAHIGYLCNARTAPIIMANPYVDRIFMFEKDEYRELWKISKRRCAKRLFSIIKEIKAERFDTVFDLSLAQEYGLFLWLAGIKRRIGYNFRRRGVFLTEKIELEGGFHAKHIVDYYIRLLHLWDNDLQDNPVSLSIYIPSEDMKRAKDVLSQKGIAGDKDFVCIAPGGGSSWGGTSFRKQWPKENFLKLANALSSDKKIKVVLLGSKEDKPICEYIREGETNCIDICGETDLLGSAGIIAMAKILVTNDGGPLHIAVSAGTDTVSIFGPVDDKVYGPYPPSEKHIVIKNESLECRPCYSNFKIPHCEHRDCLNGIPADAVIEAVRSKL